jgi:hypothetical protein
MLHRSAARALLCAGAVLAAACDRTPTDPSRPGDFEVTFLGVPADAESFTPRAITAGRVVGTARAGNAAWAVQWSSGAFTRIGPEVPAGCEAEPLAARGAFTVGQVTCDADGTTPSDAYGWAAGVGALPRLFDEPYTFVDVSRAAVIAGTIYPTASFPQATPRAFMAQNGTPTILLPPGAFGSEAVGVSDSGHVAITAYYDCASGDDDCEPTRALVLAGGEWRELPHARSVDRTSAAAVSSAGHVAGYAIGGADGIFIYDAEEDDLDPLPVVPGTRVQITGANALGQVVGTGFRQAAAPGQQASIGIVWGDGKQYSLSERILGNIDWQVTAALATDDEGRIAGVGYDPASGLEGAILLAPPNRF